MNKVLLLIFIGLGEIDIKREYKISRYILSRLSLTFIYKDIKVRKHIVKCTERKYRFSSDTVSIYNYGYRFVRTTSPTNLSLSFKYFNTYILCLNDFQRLRELYVCINYTIFIRIKYELKANGL